MTLFDQAIPALVIPAIVGLFILLKYRTDRTARAIGWYTFKPVIATPLWALLLMVSIYIPLGWIPGAALSVFLWVRYKSALEPLGTSRRWLLLLDVSRWVVSGVILSLSMGRGPFLVLALSLPTVFALFGLALVLKPATKSNWRRLVDWQTRPRAKWVFGLSWLFATSVGYMLGSWLGDQLWSVSVVGALATGAIVGLALGAAQWLVLRRRLEHSWTWITLTTLGSAAGTLVINSIYQSGLASTAFGEVSLTLLVGLIWGGFIGVAQWIGLRQYIPCASGWLWANLFGWMLAFGLYALLETTATNPMLSLGLRGVMIGTVTAVIAIRILGREPSPTELEQTAGEEPEALPTPVPLNQPGFFATHRVLSLAILISGGAVIWLVIGLWPWASDAGYFTAWERFSQAPSDAVTIVSYGDNALYLKTDTATYYGCTLGRDSACVTSGPPESKPSMTNIAPCDSAGAEYSPFSGRPQNVRSCLQVQYMHFPGGRTVYVLDQSGDLWQWHYANNLFGAALPIWVMGLLVVEIVIGAMIWTKATRR